MLLIWFPFNIPLILHSKFECFLNKNGSYQRLGAWAVLLVFLAAWSLKTAHVLLLHHSDQAKHPVCEAAYEHHGTHLHDERWVNEDCSLCAFVVSVSEPFALPVLIAFLSKLPDSESPAFYFAPFYSKKACDSAMRRGPPTA